MNPYEDRSVAYPLFTWKRVFDVYSGDDCAQCVPRPGRHRHEYKWNGERGDLADKY